jgi:hypothetical protein
VRGWLSQHTIVGNLCATGEAGAPLWPSQPAAGSAQLEMVSLGWLSVCRLKSANTGSEPVIDLIRPWLKPDGKLDVTLALCLRRDFSRRVGIAPHQAALVAGGRSSLLGWRGRLLGAQSPANALAGRGNRCQTVSASIRLCQRTINGETGGTPCFGISALGAMRLGG